MWRTSKEEWERKKSYLTRSLFEDIPILSPIYESQEPRQSSSDSDIGRPESPLPDLIIEKELPRAQKYHQDESEEFYEKLARKMRRLYRRDFLHEEVDSTTSSDMTYEMRNDSYTQSDNSIDEERSLEAEELDKVDDEDEVENYSEIIKEEETQKTMSTSSHNHSTEELDKVDDEDEVENYSEIIKEEETQKTMSTSSHNHSTEELDKVDDEDEVENYTEIIKEKETQKTMSTSFDNDSTDSEVVCLYEQRTVEAQVHTNYEDITDQPLPEIIQASEDGVDPSDRRKIIEKTFSLDKNKHDIMKKDSETIGLTEQKSLANLKEANKKSVSMEITDEYQLTPEIMRRRRTLLSDDALSYHEIPICETDKSNRNENLRMEIKKTFSTERFVASGAEMEVAADDSFSYSNIGSTMTSTPKSSKIRRSKIINKYTSRLVPYSPSSRVRSSQELNCKRTADAQVHTNYEEITDQPLPEMVQASEDGVDPSDRTIIFQISFSSDENEHDIMKKDSETLQEEGIGVTEQESLANLTEANQKSVSLKSPDEYQLTPEIMRRRQTILSDDALSCHEIPICESDKSNRNENLRMETEKRFSMERSSGAEMEVAEDSFSDSNIGSTMTSTPKSSKICRSKIINKYKSRLVPYSPSSSRGSSTQELNCKCHVALQTSFSDYEPDLNDVWDNFIVGTPNVYNICFCGNHVCS